MEEDEYGFLYPQINSERCIGCQKCKHVCAFQNVKVKNDVKEVYAAVTEDKDILMHSASGGIFATLANAWVEKGGIAFGAAFNQEWSVHHVSAVSKEEIGKLQGSKYVQSDTEKTFQQVKEMLRQGKRVLYSGTPCQIAGLYGYLGNRDENLVTIDIVCHGVPNGRMFQEYLKVIESQTGGKIQSFAFRDKKKGWGIEGKVEIASDKGKKVMTVWKSKSSYVSYFSYGWIYRECCYGCPYTNSHRPADLTIGDYWGIEREHPEYLGKNGWDESRGISLILVNTEKGRKCLEQNKELIELRKSDFVRAARGNMQLQQASKRGRREEILELYLQDGWRIVDEKYQRDIGLRKYSSQIKAVIPLKIKRKLKELVSISVAMVIER
ncbi:MAG: Coenzyme F420 hydrogenase/dehydrogenase, beta subunit C-terminal domain [Lachnospiraceae bacterium]|nr:Coenzyme F420 hydrogenase/dehydrogenase, beta subunit C-terminal domain [Lachnospiraceae bacterium]